ncbi:MAG: FAD-dependent oxidoreductase, partial [Planctomycetes bacterium]|nr:FAD-dependent oxidoreductase [Planctomycetota bacterium]
PHDHVGLSPFLVAPYSVPLRSLYAREVPNLLFAGRVMSASRLVFNSLRVMRTLAVIGQAAGTAAAHSIRTQRLPHEFSGPDLHAIQQSLLRQDCYIPRVRNEDPDDVARGARVTASSSAAFQVKPAANGLALTRPLAQILPLSAWPERVRVFVRNKGSTEAVVRGTLHRADDIWDLPALEKGDCAHVTLAVPPNSEGPVEANVEGAASAPGLFWLRLAPAPNVTWLFQADPLPGCTAAKWEKDSWMFAPGTFTEWPPFAADVLPLSRPFGPENIVNGVARPETWPNVWLSEDGLPQWCRLELPNAVDLERIQMAWGLNFHRTYSQMPPFFRAPECSRDYRIEVECGEGTRRLWAEVRGNYQRLRVHNRPPDLRGPVRAIVITIAATNGVPQVEIAEVRVYRASGRRP